MCTIPITESRMIVLLFEEYFYLAEKQILKNHKSVFNPEDRPLLLFTSFRSDKIKEKPRSLLLLDSNISTVGPNWIHQLREGITNQGREKYIKNYKYLDKQLLKLSFKQLSYTIRLVGSLKIHVINTAHSKDGHTPCTKKMIWIWRFLIL